MATEHIRTLDRVTATMDAMSLNNLMVCMRSLVRRVKVHVIHKMTHQIKMCRSKKGTEEQKAENCRKADRLVTEIQIIRHLSLDKVSKFALHNTLTIRDVKPQMDQEQKALLRLACQKAMDQHVSKWRAEHEDWKSLAAFLLTKTGRRLRKKKKKTKSETKPPQTKKPKTKENTDILDTSNPSTGPRAKDGQTVPRVDYHKFEKESKKTELAVRDEPPRKSKKPKSSKIPIDIDSGDKLVKHVPGVSYKYAEGSSSEDVDLSDMESANVKGSSEDSDLSDMESAKVKGSSEGSDISDMESGKVKESSEDSCISDMESANVNSVTPNTVQRVDCSVSHEPSHNRHDLPSAEVVKPKQTSEMVVQRINLDDLDDTDNFFVLPGEKLPEKETTKDSNPPDSLTEDRDSFFMFGDQHSNVESSDQHPEDDPERDNGQVSLARGREMLTSTFIGALCHRKDGKRSLKQSDIRKRPAWDEKKFLKDGHRNKDSTKDRPKNLKFGSDRPHKEMTKWKGTIDRQIPTKLQGKAPGSAPTETLHPSWEASRKRKQQQTGILSFQGKKTTFDDSD